MLRTGGRNEEDYERRTTSDWPAPAFAIFGHIYTHARKFEFSQSFLQWLWWFALVRCVILIINDTAKYINQISQQCLFIQIFSVFLCLHSQTLAEPGCEVDHWTNCTNEPYDWTQCLNWLPSVVFIGIGPSFFSIWYTSEQFILVYFSSIYVPPIFFGTYLCQFGNAHSVLSAEVFENGPGKLIVRWTSEWRWCLSGCRGASHKVVPQFSLICNWMN